MCVCMHVCALPRVSQQYLGLLPSIPNAFTLSTLWCVGLEDDQNVQEIQSAFQRTLHRVGAWVCSRAIVDVFVGEEFVFGLMNSVLVCLG